MREDEMEALLRLDGAALEVNKFGTAYNAKVWYPADHKDAEVVMFTGGAPSRQEALAQAWQKYQEFMQTKTGINLLRGDGQLMFRI